MFKDAVGKGETGACTAHSLQDHIDIGFRVIEPEAGVYFVVDICSRIIFAVLLKNLIPRKIL